MDAVVKTIAWQSAEKTPGVLPKITLPWRTIEMERKQ
jgi:hypothetical protein